MALQTAKQFALVPEISRLGTGVSQGQQFALNRQQSQLSGAQEGRAVTAQDQEQSELRRSVINETAINIRKLPIEQRQGALEQAGDRFRSFNIDPNFFQGADLSDASIDQVIAGTGGAPVVAKQPGFTLSPGQQRFGPTGDVIAKVDPAAKEAPEVKPVPVLAASITAGLSPTLAQKANDIFAAVGGGDKGIKAVTNIIDQGTEQERRAAAPELLKTTFPKASDAERAQLQGVMDSAKNTETGMKAAGKLREEQRRDKKVQVFQQRAIELLEVWFQMRSLPFRGPLQPTKQSPSQS